MIRSKVLLLSMCEVYRMGGGGGGGMGRDGGGGWIGVLRSRENMENLVTSKKKLELKYTLEFH